MRQESSRCLVLNADYTPLAIISWQRALLWSIKDSENISSSVEIIDFYKDDFIQGVNKKIPIPAVVKTSKYFKIHNQRVNFSRKNVFIRDNYTCQYCNHSKDINDLTYDHVIPRSLWKDTQRSPTNWTNIVTACLSCNRKKGNRTPKQANMPLKTLPVMPQKSIKYLPVTGSIAKIDSNALPKEWTLYLPETYT
jgi:hypothetical protein